MDESGRPLSVQQGIVSPMIKDALETFEHPPRPPQGNLFLLRAFSLIEEMEMRKSDCLDLRSH
jgi:hypothetical protein